MRIMGHAGNLGDPPSEVGQVDRRPIESDDLDSDAIRAIGEGQYARILAELKAIHARLDQLIGRPFQ